MSVIVKASSTGCCTCLTGEATRAYLHLTYIRLLVSSPGRMLADGLIPNPGFPFWLSQGHSGVHSPRENCERPILNNGCVRN